MLERLTPFGVTGRLEPLAELSARRERFWVLQDGEAQAELTLDEVTGFGVMEVDVTRRKKVQFREIELELLPTTEGDLTSLATPLDLPDLTPHAGDKLSHVLKLLERL